MTDLRIALKHNTDDNVARTHVAEYTIDYVTRFNERRTIAHLTHVDAMQRAIALRARGYRVHVHPTFVM